MVDSHGWHSIQQPRYHNNAACLGGRRIARVHLRLGHGGKPLCGKCALLNEAYAGPPRALAAAAGGPVGTLIGVAVGGRRARTVRRRTPPGALGEEIAADAPPSAGPKESS
ncbi:MAG: hypothetical protein FJ029_14780 [Actinobacteria bacterium]|nr:hypothetical protein [Actinomycetota bacterium]